MLLHLRNLAQHPCVIAYHCNSCIVLYCDQARKRFLPVRKGRSDDEEIQECQAQYTQAMVGESGVHVLRHFVHAIVFYNDDGHMRHGEKCLPRLFFDAP